jgi:hypothetical protein
LRGFGFRKVRGLRGHRKKPRVGLNVSRET